MRRCSRRRHREIWCSSKAGITPGPVRIASPTWVGAVPSSGGATEPPPTASPLAPAPWHAAQVAVYAARPAARSDALVTWTSGMAGPCPNDEAYATSALIAASSKAGLPRWTGAPGAESGIRPVRSMKSIEAAPTSRMDGPSLVPWPCDPWHAAQLASYSACPGALVTWAPTMAIGSGRDGTGAGASGPRLTVQPTAARAPNANRPPRARRFETSKEPLSSGPVLYR